MVVLVKIRFYAYEVVLAELVEGGGRGGLVEEGCVCFCVWCCQRSRETVLAKGEEE